MWGVYHRYHSIIIVTGKPRLRAAQLRSTMEAALGHVGGCDWFGQGATGVERLWDS